MCNKTEDMMRAYAQKHNCSYCESVFSEVLDLIAHIKETHEK
jgi:hypothetical protein